MNSILKKIFISGIAMFLFLTNSVQAANFPVNAYLFYGEGCPHCAVEREYLSQELKSKYPTLEIYEFEIYKNRDNISFLQEIAETLETSIDAVPFLVIGDEPIVGFASGITSKEIEKRVDICISIPCKDSIAQIVGVDIRPTEEELFSEEDSTLEESVYIFEEKVVEMPQVEEVGEVEEEEEIIIYEEEADSFGEEKILNLPFFGEVNIMKLSLPLLTIFMGALDGFNPCAMWTLLFLISLLIGMKNRKRMWLLGTVFITVSAFVYFLFMSAWLNLILFLGFVVFLRVVIGLLAILGGGYSLKEFIYNKNSGCKVANNEKRVKVFDRMKSLVQEKNLWMSLGGIILLAFAVNLVELLCSAGLPAVYTQVLAINDMPNLQYYMYILLYIFVFMIDDLIIFFVAMFTLEMTGVTTKYARVSRLIGGLIMLIIGLLLIFKPEWLMFG